MKARALPALVVGLLLVSGGVALWREVGAPEPAPPALPPADTTKGPAPLRRPGRGPESPPALPSAEEVSRAEAPPVDDFAEHLEEVRPLWRDTAEIVAHSTIPELVDIVVGMEERVTQAGALPPLERRALVADELQLVSFLRMRYAGFAPLEAPLDRLDAAVREMLPPAEVQEAASGAAAGGG